VSYDYTKERAELLSEKGVPLILRTRDIAARLLKTAGAFREQELMASLSGDSWQMLAAVDYLCELKELVCIFDKSARQYNVYMRPEGREL